MTGRAKNTIYCRDTEEKGRFVISSLFLMAKEKSKGHKVPSALGGTEDYDNLLIVHKDVQS